MAVAHLRGAYGPDLGPLGERIAHRVSPERVDFVRQMIARGVCSVPTSSMGRLFDAVAALLAVRDTSAYEGQAAMELEARASSSTSRRYAFDLDTASSAWRIDAAPVIRSIALDLAADHAVPEIAAAFHDAVATMIADVANRISRLTGIRRVALTGGVFQNAKLSHCAGRALQAAQLDVLEHRVVPCNDGGLALGQALLALRTIRAQADGKDRAACA
jgi:hydrogenase maturation protein HypF